jgi:hypothetical protein
MDEERACSICFESGQLYATGCACRNSSQTFLHVQCAFTDIVTRATQRPPDGDTIASLKTCFTCKQAFTGTFALLLARKIMDSSSGGPSGPYSIQVATILSYAAELLNSGAFAECELELSRAAQLGGDRVSIDSQRAMCMTKTGRIAEAEVIQREGLARVRALYGESNAIVMSHAHNLASTLSLLGRTSEAVDLLRLVHKTELATLGASNHATLQTGAMLGHVLLSAKAYPEAVDILRGVHTLMRRVFGDSGDTLVVASNLAKALFHTNALHEAEGIQRDVCAALARNPVTDVGLTEGDAKISLALTLCSQLRPSEAMALIREQFPAGSDSDFGPFTALFRRLCAAVLPAGSAVTIHGLASQPHYNGSSAVVVDFNDVTFRYRLRLPDGKLIGVRFECAASTPRADRARVVENLRTSGFEGVTETSIKATVDHWYISGRDMTRFVRNYPESGVPLRDSSGRPQQMLEVLTPGGSAYI